MLRPTISKPATASSWGAKGSSLGKGKAAAPSWSSWSKGGAKDTSWGEGYGTKGYGTKGYGTKGYDTWSSWGSPKGKGKSKGKGKARPSPPAKSEYWNEKAQEENRQEGDGSTYTGSVSSYNVRAGWGFLLPDDPLSLPDDVQAAVLAASEQLKAKGKTVDESSLLYFRKPDLAEGLRVEKGTAVSFQ